MILDSRLQEIAGTAIAQRVFPGCVIGVVRAKGERKILPFGHFTYEENSLQVAEDTIYDLASVTKSIPVASLALQFIAENRLNLSDKVKDFIPELQSDFGATIEDLLRYRVHGTALSKLRLRTFEEIRTHVFEHGFDGPAGEYAYQNLPAFLLGIILERVAGEILPALAEKYFFGPLSMRDTTFFPHDISRIPPTEIVDGSEIRGIVHDESARVFSRARRAVGHAGLFSTAPDLLNFLESLLRPDDGLTMSLVRGAEEGLGWQVNEPWMGKSRGEKTFGKTGFTGTSILVDKERGIGLVILSNRTYPKRPPDASSIHSEMNKLRSAIADIVFQTCA